MTTVGGKLGSWKLALAALASAAAAPTQDPPEVAGTVLDQDERPVAGGRIDFRSLDLRALPRRGLKGVYTLAQARHRTQIKLPRTRKARSISTKPRAGCAAV